MKLLKLISEFLLLAAKEYSWLSKILLTILISVTIVIIFLGSRINTIYYWGFLILIPLTILNLIIHRKNIYQKVLRQLRDNWGKEQVRDRNFPEIESWHRYSISADNKNDVCVDDKTWSDLNMNDLYSKIERTLTNPGECVLYEILRTPLLSDNVLKKRHEIIKLFQTDSQIREQIQMTLLRLGKQKGNIVTALLCEELSCSKPHQMLFSFLAVLALISIVVVPFLLGDPGFILIILPLYIINLLASFRVKAQLQFQLASIRYLGAMIRLAGHIAENNHPQLAEYCKKLKEAAAATEKIARKTYLLFPESALSSDVFTIISAHIDNYFLREVRIYYAVLDEIHAHRKQLKLIYQLIGELDALQSTASYLTGFSDYTVPNFTDKELLLEVKDARHPLLTNPVSNSIKIIQEKGVSITGSNMAGKTTFLRTLGVNALLAQTIYTCFAASYTGSFFKIISLINETDNIIEGKSYYLMEAERLLKIIKSLGKEISTLCIIDEPLAGTNSTERVIASLEILRYLINHNAIVAVATHDLNLANNLEFGFKSYHFTDDVDHNGLKFDYKLKEGIASTSNAIKLLEYLDYPEDIINRAMKNR
jgi:DNA mismatch repair ATPase MutS